jgi:hypothetical protein
MMMVCNCKDQEKKLVPHKKQQWEGSFERALQKKTYLWCWTSTNKKETLKELCKQMTQTWQHVKTNNWKEVLKELRKQMIETWHC